MTDRLTYGQTDRQTDTGAQFIIPLPVRRRGIIVILILIFRTMFIFAVIMIKSLREFTRFIL